MPIKEKLLDSIKDLKLALEVKEKAKKNNLYYAGIAKIFEICFEYAWKYLREICIIEGMEVYSPRDTIKTSGRLGFIKDVELWLTYLENRNLAVHDYLGISREEYLNLIEDFYSEAQKIIKEKL